MNLIKWIHVNLFSLFLLVFVLLLRGVAAGSEYPVGVSQTEMSNC